MFAKITNDTNEEKNVEIKAETALCRESLWSMELQWTML